MQIFAHLDDLKRCTQDPSSQRHKIPTNFSVILHINAFEDLSLALFITQPKLKHLSFEATTTLK